MVKTDAKLFQSVVLVGLLASMVACKSAEDQRPAEPSLTDSDQITELEQTPVAQPMNLKGQVEYSRNDLAQRLDVSVDSVALAGARQVTWRSGALGCPKPGMNYTEALVPGSVIYLQVDNTIHAYHAKIGGNPFYCPRERVEPPAPNTGDDLT